MDFGIKGKTALVCAASKGLGKGCAMALAAEGANLVILARGKPALEATAEEIRRKTGVKVTALAADITTEEGKRLALEACPNPDILVNSAGAPRPGEFRGWHCDIWSKARDPNRLTSSELIRRTAEGTSQRRVSRV